MEQDASTQPEQAYDPLVGMTVTAAGKARWRDRLAAARDALDPQQLADTRAQLLRGPAATA